MVEVVYPAAIPPQPIEKEETMVRLVRDLRKQCQVSEGGLSEIAFLPS